MKEATVADLPALLDMGRRFHADAQPEWPWSDQGFTDTLTALMADGFVRITDRGFMAGVAIPMPLNPEWLVAHEVLWWAEDGRGADLQRTFRAWAQSIAADEIRWSCRSSNERVQRFYRRFATPCEAVFSEKL